MEEIAAEPLLQTSSITFTVFFIVCLQELKYMHLHGTESIIRRIREPDLGSLGTNSRLLCTRERESFLLLVTDDRD